MRYKLTAKELSTKEAIHAKTVLELLNDKYGRAIRMEITKANAGHANSYRFILPIHALHNGEHYLTYYVIHEFAHCVCTYDTRRHPPAFKEFERYLLGIFGISIEYARAYPKALYDAKGQRVYSGRKSLKR